MTAQETLTPVEARLVAVVADTPALSQEDIASRLKVTARHVRRLLARERVRAALDAAARAGLRESTSLMGRGAVRAARALVAMAGGEMPPTNARVAACRAVLDAAGRLIDLEDMEARIAQLEAERGMQRRPRGWQ